MCCKSKTLLFSSALMLSGCASFLAPDAHTPHIQSINTEQTYVVSTSASQQMNYIKQHNSLSRICAETNADVSITDSVSLGLKDTVGDGVSLGDGEGAVALGGRDPEVLIVRELMYRACELTLNSNLNAKDSAKVYGVTLDVLERILQHYHGGRGTAAISLAPPKDVTPVMGGTGTSNAQRPGVSNRTQSPNIPGGQSQVDTATKKDVNSSANALDSVGEYDYVEKDPNAIDEAHL